MVRIKFVGLLLLCVVSAFLGPSPALAAGPKITVSPSQRAGLSTITIGSFNVHKGASAQRLDLIAREMLRGGFDVVGLQETANKMQRGITARVGSTYDYSRLGIASGHDPANAHNPSGGQIFYRPSAVRPADVQGTIDLPTPSGFHSRHAVYQLFDSVSTGARFLFVSTHLLPGGGVENSNWRSKEINTMLSAIADLNPTWPVVIVGDMNSSKGAKYKYDAPARILPSKGMPEVFKTAGAVGHGDFNSFNGFSVNPPKGGYHPDRMFASANVSVLSAEVMVRLSGNRYTTPFASDHNPIRAVIQIPY